MGSHPGIHFKFGLARVGRNIRSGGLSLLNEEGELELNVNCLRTVQVLAWTVFVFVFVFPSGFVALLRTQICYYLLLTGHSENLLFFIVLIRK
jgi:hypothetical protein